MKGVINVFMNASEMKIKRKIEGEMFETIPSSQSKNDDTMQKQLMKKVKLETPWQKSSNLGIFWCQ